MRRAAHPSGCARCGAGAGCSALKYPSLRVRITDPGTDSGWRSPEGACAGPASAPALLPKGQESSVVAISWEADKVRSH